MDPMLISSKVSGCAAIASHGGRRSNFFTALNARVKWNERATSLAATHENSKGLHFVEAQKHKNMSRKLTHQSGSSALRDSQK